MGRYVLRRVGLALFVLWAAYTVSFAILYLLPGDPADAVLSGGGVESSQADPAQVAALRRQLGVDRPVLQQYLTHLGQAVHGDFGTSLQSGARVTTTIGHALPETAKLTGLAVLFALVLAVPLAFAATATRRLALRETLLSMPALGISVPTFLVGLVLIQVVSFRWGLLPAIGNAGFSSLILPAVALALPTGAIIAQVLAKSLRTTMAQPYIDTARAKGASATRIQVRHAVRNAALPVLTLVGVIAGDLMASAAVVETVFARSGVGRVVVDAVNGRDLPVVQGVVVLSALVFVVLNLAVDLAYPFIDPRLRRAT